MNQRQVHLNSSTVSIKQCLMAIKQHLCLVSLSSILLASLGVVGVSLIPNVYRATTTILVRSAEYS